MKIQHDYRKSVLLSLKIMHQQREQICNDTLGHYSVIYNGLHEYRSENTRELYFQAYLTEWADRHWLILNEYLSRKKNEMTRNEQRDTVAFFADYYSQLIEEIDKVQNSSGDVMHELLNIKRSAINEMISYSDKWEEKNNKLQVELKKNKEQFERMIAESLKEDGIS